MTTVVVRLSDPEFSSTLISISPVPVVVCGVSCAHAAPPATLHWQWDCVVTVILTVRLRSDRTNLSGATVYAHGAAACSTRNSRPAMFSTADRAVPGFAAAAILIVAAPVPLNGETVSQLGVPVTVQAHPAAVLSSIDVDAAAAPVLNEAVERL